MLSAVALCSMLFGQVWTDEGWQPETPKYVIEERVDLISIAHVEDGPTIAFFWQNINGDWTLIDHRWLSGNASAYRDGDDWAMFMLDDHEYPRVFRIIRSTHWTETLEKESPLSVNFNKPWFARRIAPGLKPPPVGAN